MTAAQITVRTAATLVEPSAWPLEAKFVWTSDDPVAVQLTLTPDNEMVYAGEPVTFHFSRELLDAALIAPHTSFGHGDVQIEQLERCLMFRMMGDSGARHAVLVSLEPVRKFMIDTFMVVPAAAERPDVDRALELLFGSAS